jgi:hypothetical protein
MQLAATTVSTAPAKSNAKSFEEYREDFRKLGKDAGKGKDAQIKFDLLLVEGAYKGRFDLNENKHGTGRSDAVVLSEDYMKAQGSAVVFDLALNNIQKLVSNAKKCIEIGVCTQWGRDQPDAFVNEFATQWQKFKGELDRKTRRHPSNGLKLNDVHNGLMKLLTAQKKSPSLLPASERHEFCFMPEKDEKTEMEKLDDIRKAIKKTGDQSVQIKAAYDSITQRIANIVKGVK